jgi:O-antigen/teichoic acid export membrane protein
MILKNFLNKLLKTTEKDKNLIELLKGSLTFLILRISGVFFTYIFIAIISRSYGAKVMGIFALSLTILQISTVVGKVGTDTAVMRFIAEYSTHKTWKNIKKISNKIFVLIIPFSIIISFIIFLKAEWIAKAIFHKEFLSYYFKIVSFAILPNIYLMINTERLRGLKKIIKYSFLKTFAVPFFSFLFIAVSLLFIHKNNLPVLSYVLATLIVTVISMVLWIKEYQKLNNNQFNINDRTTKPNYKNLLSLSFPMFFTSSLLLIMGWTDTFMLGIFKELSKIGIYRVALRLATFTSIGLLAVNSILGPKITEHWEKKELKFMKTTIKQATVLILLLSFPIAFIFILFPSFLLGFFGEEFKIGSLSLIMLTIGQFVNALVGSVGLILFMTGKQKVIQNVVFFGAILNIVLNYFLIPKFGINGAAFASMISLMIINIIPFFLIKKYYGFYTISLRKL